MNKLPKGWEEKKFKEVLETLESGNRPKGGAQKKGIPSIGGEHLNYNGRFNFNKMKFIPKDYFHNLNKGIIKKEDVLIVKDGATTGKTSFVSDDFPYENSAVNEHVFIARSNDNIIPKLLFYFLFSGEGQEQLKKAITGSAQGGINLSILDKILIKFPTSLKQQTQIVQEIEKQFTRLDATVKDLKSTKEKLEIYRKSVLKKAFEGGQDWKKEKIGEVFITNPKKSEINELADDTKISFIPMKSISEKTKEIKNGIKRDLSEVRKGYTYFKNGDILLAKITPCFENGKIAVAKKLINGVGFGSTEFHIFRFKEKILPNFLFYFLQNEKFRSNAKRNMTGTAGQLRVPIKFIEDYTILFPPIKQQTKIVKQIEKQFSIIDKLEQTVNKSLNKTEQLRKSILKSAFEGKLK